MATPRLRGSRRPAKPIDPVPLFFAPTNDQSITELGPAIGPGGSGYTETCVTGAIAPAFTSNAAAQAATPPGGGAGSHGASRMVALGPIRAGLTKAASPAA